MHQDPQCRDRWDGRVSGRRDGAVHHVREHLEERRPVDGQLPPQPRQVGGGHHQVVRQRTLGPERGGQQRVPVEFAGPVHGVLRQHGGAERESERKPFHIAERVAHDAAVFEPVRVALNVSDQAAVEFPQQKPVGIAVAIADNATVFEPVDVAFQVADQAAQYEPDRLAVGVAE